MQKVIKRDGREVLFNNLKIFNAIAGAYREKYNSVDEYKKDIEDIVTNVEKTLEPVDTITVEQVQDIVEKEIMKVNPDVAKLYILYRNERSKAREINSSIMKKVIKRTYAIEVENMNANVDEHTFSGREKEASGDVQKILALDYDGLSYEISKAHKDMLIYQHDLDKAVLGEHNCLFLDFEHIFTNGFESKNGDVRSPKSFASACQLIAVIFQCQSQVNLSLVY